MSDRYQIKKETFFVVVDTEAAEEAQQVHYEGRDEEFAVHLADDLNTNHQNRLDAQERIQEEARQQHIMELMSEGTGEDRAS